MESSDESLVFSPEEVRRRLKISRGLLYTALKNGTIPSIRLSARKIVIPKHSFLEWLSRGGNNMHPQERK